MIGKIVAMFIAGAIFASSMQAWVIVNEDGTTEKLNNCCPKKVYKKKVYKKKVYKKKAPEVCETCDYSKFQEAVLLPVGDEKLQPATLRNCD